MLIGVLVVVALALLISAFLTGTTVLAGAALVVSLAAAVLYVIALRRDPDGADGSAAATAEDGPEAPVEKTAAAAGTDQERATATEAAVAKTPEKKTPQKKAPEKAAAPAVAKTPEKAPETKAPEKKAPEKAATPAVAKAPEKKAPEKATSPAVTTAPETSAAAPELAGTTVVHVVPGRMRYHVQGCQVIDGQQVEDLTVDDARDEGFTACSRCAARGRSHATA
ncbi:hypothetical protein [Actinomycetospora corticicola]|uniref:Outer membrane biosynthesis protein TonB n=1 Tax=Actinomycetospora corticicola TaxID=663602 RepID=A0A7Y9J7V2_9PSEU|nr:hypothetical protein [Actinomycetospora corticicola]NYD38800.1 outer membrane biosynthesis protein TonB [Actinomycetospora corticicola]